MCRCISDGKKHIKTQQLHLSARMALSLQDKDLVQTHLGPQMRGSSLLYKVDTKWEQSTHLCWRTAEAIFYCCIVFFPPECSYSSKTNALHSVDMMRDEERGDSKRQMGL